MKGGIKMKEEISLEAVFLAVNELAQHVTQLDERLNGKIDSLDERLNGKINSLGEDLNGKIDSLDERLTGKIDSLGERLGGRLDSLEARFDNMEINTKQEFDKVHDKLDVMETQMTIFAGNLSKTQAEVMVLKNAT